mmetsp:Transcript_9217/g.18130  ORF Transcript_9217/g.18130 Transcript_9217/m.18130 type:complete len:231 (+) Transcript_9217:654-1346(+)
MHGTYGEVIFTHSLRKCIHFSALITKNYTLCNGEHIVEVAECIKFPLLSFDRHKKLLDSLESEFIALHEHADRVVHEFASHAENWTWHGGTNKYNLDSGGHVPVNVIDLLLKPTLEELISLINNELADLISAKVLPADHVKHTTGCARDNLCALVKSPNIFTEFCTTNAESALYIKSVTEREQDLLGLFSKFTGRRKDECLSVAFLVVDNLQDTNAKNCSLTCSTLALSN